MGQISRALLVQGEVESARLEAVREYAKTQQVELVVVAEADLFGASELVAGQLGLDDRCVHHRHQTGLVPKEIRHDAAIGDGRPQTHGIEHPSGHAGDGRFTAGPGNADTTAGVEQA